MRYKAPQPLTAVTEVITNGYELCARCGKVMMNNESAIVVPRHRAIVVPRFPSWLIYAHPEGPDCPAKAVKGWLAVRRAERKRSSRNVITPRAAEPVELVGLVRDCVCLLDDKHIGAELSLVDYKSGEIPTKPNDVRQLFSDRHFRMTGGGKRASNHSPDEYGDTEGIGSNWQIVARNGVEDDLIAAIDSNTLTSTLEVAEEIVRSCRQQTYATGRAVQSEDVWPKAIVGGCDVSELTTSRSSNKSRLPMPHRDVLTWDSSDNPGEYALHSSRVCLKLDGRRVTELQAWSPKPEPSGFWINSHTNPSSYDFRPAPKRKAIRHWPRGESHKPYGQVAVAKLGKAVRARSETGVFVPKPNSEGERVPRH